MSQNNKLRTTGLKLVLLSIVVILSCAIPAFVEVGPYIVLIGFALFIIGLIVAVKDAIYNRRIRKESKNQPVAQPVNTIPVESSAVPSTSAQPTPAPSPAKPSVTVERVRVRGVDHYAKNVEAVATENPDYDLSKRELQEDFLDERVYQYTYDVKADLVPEPDNEYDPNAIMVTADGVCIGHVPKGSTAHIRKLMELGRIKRMELNIGGGKYKEVSEVDDGKYELERGERPFSAVLELYLAAE